MRRLLVLLLISPALAFGQGSDSALKDRVDQLIEKLAAKDEKARDAAEKALVGLGAKVIPLLPDPAKVSGDETRKRLDKVRVALAEDMEKASLVASKVTIQGKSIRLTEVLKQLQVQTGNRITDLREANGADVTNPAIDLDLKDMVFFEALDLIAAKAEISLDFNTGDGTIGIMPGMGAGLPEQVGDDPVDNKAMLLYSGPFRIQFKQYSSSRDLSTGQTGANAQFDVAWEPRLRPMLLGLKAENVTILDDLGEKVTPTVDAEAGNVVLRPENPIAEMNVNMTAPQRKAQEIASLKVKAEVTMPAGIRSFKFPSLAETNVTKKQGDVSVILESSEVDEAVWKVRVMLQMPGEGPAFESYRQGLFNNRIWLQKADGTRFEHNGGFNSLGSDAGKLGFEYLFVDAPGKPSEYGLVYETPSRVLTIPLEFEFKKVPLP
ncbi:MAG: hypothetical protein JWN86_3143 [Planctomycetota bacterium]|nr:hypothetical protein [Planctomycetota bacterium]